MKIISLFNLKGGVGKTVSSVNIATILALKGKKVLLIDDSPSSEKLFNKILSETNIELTSVKLGKEGLEKIRNKEKYDLILLDEELEPQNGHIIMRKLLEIRNFNIKVILLTKDNKYDYDDSYLQEGFTDYIIKSSDKEEMLNKMNKYLS